MPSGTKVRIGINKPLETMDDREGRASDNRQAAKLFFYEGEIGDLTIDTNERSRDVLGFAQNARGGRKRNTRREYLHASSLPSRAAYVPNSSSPSLRPQPDAVPVRGSVIITTELSAYRSSSRLFSNHLAAASPQLRGLRGNRCLATYKIIIAKQAELNLRIPGVLLSAIRPPRLLRNGVGLLMLDYDGRTPFVSMTCTLSGLNPPLSPTLLRSATKIHRSFVKS
ncbi:hypothetical protein HPP92_000561 [Vanilla planifolia]|uniref:Uncharacterized protein n=1 Tax=Vanilla planifolia TaxID=51239 RepID=A0A835RWM9_VANPL|nr:hypothetical protein HPP92_000561 [Vanilla planifolia]